MAIDILAMIAAGGPIVEKVLTFLASRHDLAESVRKELNLEAVEMANLALAWMALHPVDLTDSIHNDFRVRDQGDVEAGSRADGAKPTDPE